MTNVHTLRRHRNPDGASDPPLELDEDSIASGYALLFEPTMRAAQIACLGFAQLIREDRWPDASMVCGFARLYRLSPAELGAFFGLVSCFEGGEVIWVDAMRGPVPPYTALDRAAPNSAWPSGSLGWPPTYWRRKRRPLMRKPAVPLALRDLNGEPLRIIRRKCLCCWREVDSTGPGHRLCAVCRGREVSPYAL